MLEEMNKAKNAKQKSSLSVLQQNSEGGLSQEGKPLPKTEPTVGTKIPAWPEDVSCSNLPNVHMTESFVLSEKAHSCSQELDIHRPTLGMFWRGALVTFVLARTQNKVNTGPSQ